MHDGATRHDTTRGRVFPPPPPAPKEAVEDQFYSLGLRAMDPVFYGFCRI